MNEKITIQKMAMAFELWEKDFRASPETYMTNEQMTENGVSKLSAGRAAYFYKLLSDIA